MPNRSLKHGRDKLREKGITTIKARTKALATQSGEPPHDTDNELRGTIEYALNVLKKSLKNATDVPCENSSDLYKVVVALTGLTRAWTDMKRWEAEQVGSVIQAKDLIMLDIQNALKGRTDLREQLESIVANVTKSEVIDA